MRYGLKSLLVATGLIAILICVTKGCVSLLNSWMNTPVFGRPITDEWGWWTVAAMIVHYEDDHQGSWPDDWEDLRPYYLDTETIFGQADPGENYDYVLPFFAAHFSLESPETANRVIAYREINEDSSWFGRKKYEWESEQDKEFFKSVTARYEPRVDELGRVHSPRPPRTPR